MEPGRVGASGGGGGIERLEGDQRALRAGTAVEGGREPGEGYSIYRCRDELGTLPGEIESVITFGARWVGVEEEKLLKVSEGYERRLCSWNSSLTRTRHDTARGDPSPTRPKAGSV